MADTRQRNLAIAASAIVGGLLGFAAGRRQVSTTAGTTGTEAGERAPTGGILGLLSRLRGTPGGAIITGEGVAPGAREAQALPAWVAPVALVLALLGVGYVGYRAVA